MTQRELDFTPEWYKRATNPDFGYGPNGSKLEPLTKEQAEFRKRVSERRSAWMGRFK